MKNMALKESTIKKEKKGALNRLAQVSSQVRNGGGIYPAWEKKIQQPWFYYYYIIHIALVLSSTKRARRAETVFHHFTAFCERLPIWDQRTDAHPALEDAQNNS